jgi:pimeloyl-ACP methyl ester carboxylesterase
VRRVAQQLAAYAGVLAFDFRGHGGSTGLSTVGDREVLDLEAAVAAARGRGYRRVVTLGFSMGGSVAVRHAALHGGVDAVVAVSAPARWYYRGTRPMRRVHWVIERRTGRAVARRLLGTRVAGTRWDPVPESPTEVAPRIAPTPLLVVHGDHDPYLPVEHAEALHAAAGEPRELWLVPGYGHAEAAMTPALLARLGRHLSALVGARRS